MIMAKDSYDDLAMDDKLVGGCGIGDIFLGWELCQLVYLYGI